MEIKNKITISVDTTKENSLRFYKDEEFLEGENPSEVIMIDIMTLTEGLIELIKYAHDAKIKNSEDNLNDIHSHMKESLGLVLTPQINKK